MSRSTLRLTGVAVAAVGATGLPSCATPSRRPASATTARSWCCSRRTCSTPPTRLTFTTDISAFQPLVQTLVDEASAFDGPVYLVNGDSHVYNSDRPSQPARRG